MEIFDEFVVVDEKAIADLCIEYGPCANSHGSENPEKLFSVRDIQKCCVDELKVNFSKFSDVTQFAALEFRIYISKKELEIKDICNDACENVPLAQIIHWEWNEDGSQRIRGIQILHMGGDIMFNIRSPHSAIVVRILKKREKGEENPCAPLSTSPDDGLTIQIGDKKITVSAHWLMTMSPVISQMLSVKMHKQQRSLSLDELGVDMEQFMEFLEAISPIALQTPILPNPFNVLVLLKLADFFQVDWLKSRCEAHLINCVELPLIERFLLIERYGLNSLKNYFLHLNVDKLRTFFKANREQLLPVISKEFFADLSIRLCG